MTETITAADFRASKPRKKPRHIEDGIQKQIVTVFRSAYPSTIIFAVPNGGGRSKTEAAIMNGTGTLAGVADLVICWQGGVGFMEVKAPGKYLRKAQKEFRDACERIGHRYAVVRSVPEALQAFEEWRRPA